MVKLTDNLLHQQIIHNIHLYATIANILLLLVQFLAMFTVRVATATDKRLANKILLLRKRNFSPCVFRKFS